MAEVTDELVHRYTDAAGANDYPAATRLAQKAVTNGASVTIVLRDLVCKSQGLVGRRWAEGEWTVQQEHTASAVTSLVIEDLARLAPPLTQRSPEVLVTSAEGDWHGTGPAILDAALLHHGRRSIRMPLGAAAGQVAGVIHDLGPECVVVSCSLPALLPGARRMVVAAQDAGTPAVVGGRGFGTDDRRAERLGANGWAADVVELADLVEATAGFSMPSARFDYPGAAEYATLRQEAGVVTDRVRALLEGPDDHSGAVDAAVWLLKALAASLLLDDSDILSEDVDWFTCRAPITGLSVSRLLEALLHALPETLTVAKTRVRAEVERAQPPTGGK